MWVGPMTRITAAFPERNIRIAFRAGVPRYLEPRIAALFTPTKDWIVGLSFKVDEKTRHVLVRRSVALGDVIASHAAIKGFAKRFPHIKWSIQTSPQYADMLMNESIYTHVISSHENFHGKYDFDSFVSLDNFFEWDHSRDGPRTTRSQRAIERIAEAIEMPADDIKTDFSLTIPETKRRWAHDEFVKRDLIGKKVIAVQARAVQKPRDMEGNVEAITRGLLEAFPDAHVMLVENEANRIFKGERIHAFPGSGIIGGMALLERCDVLCCMDSGAMWMGHCVAIPTVVWFGPTPPETKIIHHPLYPDGVRSLLLNEMVGCPEACYENAKWCDWRYACMKHPPLERVVRETVEAVGSLIK